MRRRRIPDYPLEDYLDPQLAATGVYVGRFEASLAVRPNRMRVHRHQHFELFRLRGRGTHFNDFSEYALQNDSVVIVRPGQVHGWPKGEDLRGTMVGFTQEFFDGDRRPPSVLLRHDFLQDGRPARALDTAAARSLDAAFAAIASEFDARESGWEGVVRNYLHILLAQLARLAARDPAKREPKGRAAELIRRFHLLVEAQFRTTKSVAGYARQLGVSPGHLNDVLREHAGRTASDSIQERVLLEARRCLLHSGLSVSEVGYGLGYGDPSYFARFFRRGTGLSPLVFRETHRERCQSSRDPYQESRLREAPPRGRCCVTQNTHGLSKSG